jgi:hypothetical protein
MMQKAATNKQLVTRHGTGGHRGVQSATQHEKDDVGQFAAQFVRQTGPHKTTTDIEQAQQGA